MYTKVIVDVSSSNVDTEFEYSVPIEFEPFILPGARVIVSFGVREVFGFVLEVYAEKRFLGISKDILDLLDYTPIITKEQLELAKYINTTTTSMMISCLNLMIPDSLKGKTEKYIHIIDYSKLDAELAIIFGGKTKLKYDKGLSIHSRKIMKAAEQGLVEITYQAKQIGNIKKVIKYRIKQGYLNDDYIEIKSLRRREVLHTLSKQEYFLTKDELCDTAECSSYMIQSILELGYFDQIVEEVYRNQNSTTYHSRKHIVNEDNPILKQFTKQQAKPILCHFSNNDQATKAYLDVIGTFILERKKILFIVPNFLLIAQYFMLFSSKFVADIAIFDSSIPNGEYYDSFRRLRKGEIDIAIGTKKAGFLPIEHFDLIIIDGEESQNYINEQSPRYHLIDVMVHRALSVGIPILLTTISPSIERYEKALRGEYTLYEAKPEKLPMVRVVDMKQELRDGNRSVLSRELSSEISNTLSRNEQSMIILNHKGYSQFVICRSCGYVVKCPKCKVSLKYSKRTNQLECGYCTFKQDYLVHCPKCNSSSIRQMGYGLEQLEEKLRDEFKDVRILRVDADLNKTSKSYEDVMRKIEEHDVDIIIGTEVLIRYLAYDRVKLIAVLSADFLLSLPDYKSREMTYQMLTQAVSKLEAKTNSICLIQVYESNHFVIATSCTKDYLGFLEKEYQYRSDGFYPPFSKVHRIYVKGSYKETFKVANTIKKTLLSSIRTQKQVLGPAVNEKMSAVQLIIKVEPNVSLDQLYQIIYEEYQNSKFEIVFERYPVSLT